MKFDIYQSHAIELLMLFNSLLIKIASYFRYGCHCDYYSYISVFIGIIGVYIGGVITCFIGVCIGSRGVFIGFIGVIWY